MLWTAHSWPNYVKVCVDLVWQRWFWPFWNMIWTTDHPFHHPNTHAWGAFALHGALTLNRPEHKMNDESTLLFWHAYTTEHMIPVHILTGLHLRPWKALWIPRFYSNSRLENSPTHRPVALFRADARSWWTPGIFPQQCWMKDFCRSFGCCIIVCLPGQRGWKMSLTAQIRTQRSLKFE